MIENQSEAGGIFSAEGGRESRPFHIQLVLAENGRRQVAKCIQNIS